MARPIYVEILIRAPFEALWSHTQDPALHQRWDLRFSTIKYLSRESENEPQRFLYETRIGFGLRIRGTGESVGTHDTPTQSTSALKFGSADRMSLILAGSGYWKYIRQAGGVRFLTSYDYRTRFGAVGRIIDGLLFRPLLGWATAWSFDRLRLWLERGIDPALSAQRAATDAVCRAALAFVWMYHGLVPKLIHRQPGEMEPLLAAGFSPEVADGLVVLAGWMEIALGMALLAFGGRALYVIAIVMLLALAAGALATVPSMFIQPFNPLTLTLAMIALAAIGFTACQDLPSALRCVRRPPQADNT